jgi:hypothetical protein
MRLTTLLLVLAVAISLLARAVVAAKRSPLLEIKSAKEFKV